MIITELAIRRRECGHCQFLQFSLAVEGTLYCGRFNKSCLEVQPEECLNAAVADQKWKKIMDQVNLAEAVDRKKAESTSKSSEPIKKDMIRHPDHYTFRGTEAIEAVKILTATANGVEAYLLGCAVKYLYRYPRKNGDQDLAKAEQCIYMLREHLAKREAK